METVIQITNCQNMSTLLTIYVKYFFNPLEEFSKSLYINYLKSFKFGMNIANINSMKTFWREKKFARKK
jgi:hypothetical protein